MICDNTKRNLKLENRSYANVIPLPETRVVLQRQGDDDKTEYINANYVRVSQKTKQSKTKQKKRNNLSLPPQQLSHMCVGGKPL